MRTSLKNQVAQLRNLEVQMGQMASLFNVRQQGNLRSTSEVNPTRDRKEHNKAITLRSGKMVETTIHSHEDKENSAEENDKDVEASVQDEKKYAKTMRNADKPLQNSIESTPKRVKESSIEEKPIVPYPQRTRIRQLNQQFSKFMEIFKKLHINIPFVEELEQMSGYVKFMKDILSKKRKSGDYKTVAFSKECNAILQKKLPPDEYKKYSSFNPSFN